MSDGQIVSLYKFFKLVAIGFKYIVVGSKMGHQVPHSRKALPSCCRELSQWTVSAARSLGSVSPAETPHLGACPSQSSLTSGSEPALAPELLTRFVKSLSGLLHGWTSPSAQSCFLTSFSLSLICAYF